MARFTVIIFEETKELHRATVEAEDYKSAADLVIQDLQANNPAILAAATDAVCGLEGDSSCNGGCCHCHDHDCGGEDK